MPRQGERDAHVAARIEEPEQHALALAHTDRLAMSEHTVVERRRLVHDLQAVVGRRPFLEILQAHPLSLPMMSGERDLAVVSSGIAGGRVDDQKAELAGIGALDKSVMAMAWL